MNKLKESHNRLNAIITFVENDTTDKNKIYYVAKDNISTKGIKTTAGSNYLKDYCPIYDATVIKKLNDNNGVLLAKTSMDELGMGGTGINCLTGPVKNPFDSTRISGGSSGGSAALVGDKAINYALATDTGDSIRKPAGFCNAIGVKPTYGRVSRYGVVPYASSLDHVGFFTSTIKQSCKLLSIIQGYDPLDMSSSDMPLIDYVDNLTDDVKNKKIGIFKNVVDLMTNKDQIEAFNNLIATLKAKGAIISYIELSNELLRAALPTYTIISNCEASANHSNLDGIRFGIQENGNSMDDVMINSRTKGFSYNVRKRMLFGSFGLYEKNQEYIFKKAQKIRRLLCDQYIKQIEDLDAILAPSSLGVPPTFEEATKESISDEYLIGENHLILSNFTGFPSMTVPLCFSEGLPFGINITCKAYQEMTMFNIANTICNIVGICNEVEDE